MKTQIIQLNQHEDYLSVRDKIDWSQTKRVLLVWPDHGQVLPRKLDLKLIDRHAVKMGARLGLLTSDTDVKLNADDIGIPVFENLANALNTDWGNKPHRKIAYRRHSQYEKLEVLQKSIQARTPELLEKPVTKVICLVISMCAILLLAGFLLPSAKIVVTPNVETQSMVFDVFADPSATMINYSAGSLPAYNMDVIIEGHDFTTASGTIVYPDKSATGSLRITNISDHEVTIPVGTIISTPDNNPIRFITKMDGEVILDPSQAKNVDIQAMKPGLSGNLTAGQSLELEGALASVLEVDNLSAISGGTERTVPSPTAQDQETLYDRLQSKLADEALKEIQSNLPIGDTIIPPSLAKIETLQETIFPAVGEPGNQLELTLQLRFQAQVVSMASMHNLVEPIMNSYTPDGYQALVNTIDIIQSSTPTLAQDKKAHWRITATRQLIANIPEAHLANRISGEPRNQVMEHLSSSLPISGQPQIILTPSWWPRLPFLAMRIKFMQTQSQ